MYFFYQLILLLASPLLAIWMLVRAFLGRMPGLGQRLGIFPNAIGRKSGPRVWLHAVSLGEVKVAAELAAELRERGPDLPNLEVIFTTSTRTGQQEAHRSAGSRDTVLFPPIDFAWVCRRFLNHLQPDVLLIVETELWPNLFRQARLRDLPLLIVNGRISDRSWPRYRSTKWFWRAILGAVDRVYASSQADADRFAQLGAPSHKLTMAGNLKFRSQPPATPSEFVRAATAQLAQHTDTPVLADTKVLVAGSTMAGEEAILIDAFRALAAQFPALWMILAPRHPERFDEVARLLQDAGLTPGINVARRSQWQAGQPVSTRGVLLLDTIGELSSLYRLATVAFVGGTLAATGGHNILEPACWGKPIVVGPSMENFREIMDQFLATDSGVKIPGARTGSVVQIADAATLLPVLRHLLTHPQDAARLGESARAVIQRSQQSSSIVSEEIVNLLRRTRSTEPQGNSPASPASRGPEGSGHLNT